MSLRLARTKMFMTLREMGENLHISRRAIQGYESHGLAAPSGKNKYGHLLYDEQAQNRIKTIRLYQELGFSLKEIENLIDAPKAVLKEALIKQLEVLKQQEKDKEAAIRTAERLIREYSLKK